jgi:hypothetical protein
MREIQTPEVPPSPSSRADRNDTTQLPPTGIQMGVDMHIPASDSRNTSAIPIARPSCRDDGGLATSVVPPQISSFTGSFVSYRLPSLAAVLLGKMWWDISVFIFHFFFQHLQVQTLQSPSVR